MYATYHLEESSTTTVERTGADGRGEVFGRARNKGVVNIDGDGLS